jgi:primosomal protein N'
MAQDGLCVGVGLASPLGQKFALWDQVGIAAEELAGRRELGFPPHFRMASITGPRELVDDVVSDLAEISDKPGAIEVLGPLLLSATHAKKTPNDAIFAVELWRYLVRFEYSVGDKLATELKARALKVNASTKRFNATTGRASRAVKVKLDDSEVI